MPKHMARSQVKPVYPLSHLQSSGEAHVPWAEQTLVSDELNPKHSLREHFVPVYPDIQEQESTEVQVPWPLQTWLCVLEEMSLIVKSH